MARSSSINSYLIGRGGVGLVVFHLARMQIEFVAMPEGSPFGDIWIERDGAKKIVEVKTSKNGLVWHISKRQLESSHFYCLVDMKLGYCHVMTTEDVLKAMEGLTLIGGNLAIVPRAAIPSAAFNN